MRIKINKEEKIELLKALNEGFIDTDKIPVLKELLSKYEPARILTRQEAGELLKQIESEH